MSEYSEILDKVEKFVELHCALLDSAHDWDHVRRVRDLALRLYLETYSERDETIRENVELAALLHDVGDSKFGYDQKQLVGDFLTGLVDSERREFLLDQIGRVSWRKSLKSENPKDMSDDSKELVDYVPVHYFVSDADRLDAMGAIGIARTFSYGGSRHSKLYDLSIKPDTDLTKEAYDAQTDILKDGKVIPASSKNNTLNHFYEKLFKLQDSLKTEAAKKLGKHRHQRMVDFVQDFLLEIASES